MEPIYRKYYTPPTSSTKVPLRKRGQPCWVHRVQEVTIVMGKRYLMNGEGERDVLKGGETAEQVLLGAKAIIGSLVKRGKVETGQKQPQYSHTCTLKHTQTYHMIIMQSRHGPIFAAIFHFSATKSHNGRFQRLRNRKCWCQCRQ